MILLRAQDIAKYFDGEPVFSGVSLEVAAKERLGIVGPNGAGKSTLLRILAGHMEPDEGSVYTLGEDVSRSMMSQESDLPGDVSVLGAIMGAFDELRKQEDHLRRLETEIASARDDDERTRLMERYGRLMTQFEDKGGYGIEARAREILGGLGFGDDALEREVRSFSGGERVRLALARALLEQPTILLLDEPTNHLDIESSEWLEEFLRGYPGTIVVVSHDRYFLDRVASGIVEIHAGRVERYPGNYSAFLSQRTARRELQWKRYEKQREEIARLEDFVRRYAAGQRAREAKDRQKKIERMDRIEPPPELPGGMQLTLRAPRSGREVLRARGLRIRRGDRVLVEHLDLDLYRQQRIALLGPNGSGKTSLLRVLVGEDSPDEGEIHYGVGVTTGYFPQDLAFPDESLGVVDELRRPFPGMHISEARDYLARFGFIGEEVFDPLHTLSGGERTRLHLARLSLAEATLLVLDEPTNHLDLAARESLESAAAAFDGTLIFVTHDRYFVDNVATDLWVLENGRLESYLGGYSEYRRMIARRASPEKRTKERGASMNRGRRKRKTCPGKTRATRVRVEDLAAIEEQIEVLEREREEVAAHLGDPTAYDDGSGAELVYRYREIEQSLAALYEDWEEVGRMLEERNEV